jgi:sirohydrochlorin ferrochelatase
LAVDEASLAQHLEMMADRRASQVEAGGQVANTRLAALGSGDPGEQLQADRVAQSLEHGGEFADLVSAERRVRGLINELLPAIETNA